MYINKYCVFALILFVAGCTTGPVNGPNEAITSADARIVGNCNIMVNLINSSNNSLNNSVGCKNLKNTLMIDSEECQRRSPVGYIAMYPTGIPGLIISPAFFISNEISKIKAQSEANEIYTRCMEGRGYIMNGYGTHTYENGNVYQGHWKDGNFDGRGIFRWKDGGSYDGEWKDGTKSGTGTDIYADGVIYKGSFENDVRSGTGVQIWPDGRRFEGIFRDDKPSGHGIFTLADGDRYEGTWLNGCFRDGDRQAWVNQNELSCH